MGKTHAAINILVGSTLVFKMTAKQRRQQSERQIQEKLSAQVAESRNMLASTKYSTYDHTHYLIITGK